MSHSSPRTNEELSQIYRRNADTVYRICFLYLKNEFDADDVTADTFCKLITYSPSLENEEHEKAWLIRVAINLCKNRLRSWWNKTAGLEEAEEKAEDEKQDETLEAVLRLPEKYKTAIYLHYYEGYSTPEIAKMLKTKESTVYGHLHTGRKLLKMQWE